MTTTSTSVTCPNATSNALQLSFHASRAATSYSGLRLAMLVSRAAALTDGTSAVAHHARRSPSRVTSLIIFYSWTDQYMYKWFILQIFGRVVLPTR
jgi:hypothetical protein